MDIKEIKLETQIANITIDDDARMRRMADKDRDIATRIALMMAAGETVDRDLLPKGYKITGNTVCTVEGYPVPVVGHGVDIDAVNRSTAHMAGAAL